MHNQNQLPLITSHTGRVQLITEVQVQEHHHVHTVLLHQTPAITGAARQQEVAAAVAAIVITVVEAEAAVVHPLVFPAEVLQEAAVEDVHRVVVHHLQAAVNFRKHINI
jgi:hypothetical protein